MNYHDYPLLLMVSLGLLLAFTSLILILLTKQFKTQLTTLNKTLEKMLQFTRLDVITGLPIRSLFFENFQKAINIAKKKEQKVALLFLDIDDFWGIKNSFGYAFSDALLMAVAKRLMIIVHHKKDLLAHFRSDQFAIISEYGHEEKTIHHLCNQITKSLSKPFMIMGNELNITFSIGISIYPTDGTHIEQLLKNAGAACHQSKKSGTHTYNFYNPNTQTSMEETQRIISLLLNAAENKELVACYQAKVDVQTRKIVGAEALLHWNSPILGRVSPAKFIPIAEQTGLIVALGKWILKEACAQTKKWHDNGFPNFTIAINLSSYQFKTGDIAEQVAETIWENNLDPKKIELEITESAIMDNIEKSLLMLKVLKAMGIKIAIDDFGTGYSSLSQLKTFPVNYLKIDQSFIKNIHNKNKASDEAGLVVAIIAMAKELGIKVIAEGVETENEFNFLKEQGCDLIQGYLFSKPISAEEFTKLLEGSQQQALETKPK